MSADSPVSGAHDAADSDGLHPALLTALKHGYSLDRLRGDLFGALDRITPENRFLSRREAIEEAASRLLG